MISSRYPRQQFVRWRRRFFEGFGSQRYSRLGLYDLDHKLEKYLDFRGGFFVELGANDGLDQSNTYYLERWLGWRGILIEPLPDLYKRAACQRPKARVFQCACVPFDYSETHATMRYANLMSVVKGSWKDPELEAQHVATGSLTEPYEIQVPARTLTSILEECRAPHIDFLSLDVEGSEVNVLRGLDFARYAPAYILVEVWDKTEVDTLLADRYDCIGQLTMHDFLYRLK